MKRLSIDIWSDIACPWCYVGKRRLEAALAEFPYRDQVDIHWRAFELDPSAPAERDPGVSQAQRLASKYGMSEHDAQARIDQLRQTAAGDGLDLRFDKVRSGNTFDGHRLVHLAQSLGKGEAAKERLLRAYMTEGQSVADHEVLVRLGVEVGLDADAVRAMLASDDFTAEVRADEAEAAKLGIRGVPSFVFDERLGVSGAQSSERLLQVITQAWIDLNDGRSDRGTAPGLAGSV